MPGCWIERHERKGRNGGVSYRVRFRIGGRESVPQWAGAFATKREAEARRQWVRAELAAMRLPNLQLVQPVAPATLREVAERWRTSRIDASDGTRATHLVNLGRILPVLGDKSAAAVTKADVQELVARLHATLARESVRKTIAALAMVLDHAEINPNPARKVRLPEKRVEEVNPPTARHVEAVLPLLPTAYRLPMIVLDSCGLRVGELEQVRWGDIDEYDGRWRVSAATAKTRKARWVPVPATVFNVVVALVPREDRDLNAQVFFGFGADRFRTAITRACKAAGVPAFSPHDLRHRRASLWHLRGVPAVEAATWLGHSPTEHLRTYAHATLVWRTIRSARGRSGDRSRGVRRCASMGGSTLVVRPKRRTQPAMGMARRSNGRRAARRRPARLDDGRVASPRWHFRRGLRWHRRGLRWHFRRGQVDRDVALGRIRLDQRLRAT